MKAVGGKDSVCDRESIASITDHNNDDNVRHGSSSSTTTGTTTTTLYLVAFGFNVSGTTTISSSDVVDSGLLGMRGDKVAVGNDVGLGFRV